MSDAGQKRALRLTMGLLEEDVSADVLTEFEAEPTVMGAELRSWFEAALRQIESHPDLAEVASSSPHIPAGSLDEIRVLFCSPSALDLVFDAGPRAIGLFLVDTPDHDPFLDEAPQARALRVLIAWDPAVVRQQIEDAIRDDRGEIEDGDLPQGAMGWLVTLTHELHHALWFAGNGNFNSAADLDVMTDDIGHDLFDITTGYGIRPVVIAGMEIEPEDAEDAHFLMEDMIEERGRRLAEEVFLDDLGPERFLTLLDRAIGRSRELEVQP